MNNKVLLGSTKGLIILEQKNGSWEVSKIDFIGFQVSMVFVDNHLNKWWVALDHKHWGSKMHCSANEGKSWQEVKAPEFHGFDYKENVKAHLKRIWAMCAAGADRPGCYWVGTEPGALFYTEDDGKHFTLNKALWDHPSRQQDNQWFGAGRDFPFIHSIVVNPKQSDAIMVAVSCAGVFGSNDNGKSWDVKNQGLQASYLPNPNADVGHDPHMMISCAANPQVIWQQNHCGIYRSENQGNTWVNKSGKNGFPYYGFALAVDEDNPEEAWVIPAKSDEVRVAAGLKLAVYHTLDGGESWEEQANGLPVYPAFGIVLRQALAKRGKLMVFGTNNGNVFISEDKGDHWNNVSTDLPTINCVAIC